MPGLTSTEAAMRANLTREQLLRRVQTGEISGQLVAGRWLIDEESVDDYLARLAHARDHAPTV